MTCTEAREALLTADLGEMGIEGDGALASHLTECTDCARVAAQIASHTSALARLVATRPASGAGTRDDQRLRRTAWRTALPIAAAIAGILLVRHQYAHSPLQSGSIVTTGTGVSVECKTGQTATVIPTTDPKITIIWLSEGGTE